MVAVPEFAAPRDPPHDDVMVRETLAGGDVRVEDLRLRVGRGAAVQAGAAHRRMGPALTEQVRLEGARMLNDAPMVGRATDAMIAELRDRTAAARNPSP